MPQPRQPFLQATRRNWLKCASALAVAGLLPFSGAWSQPAWPAKPIKLVIPLRRVG